MTHPTLPHRHPRRATRIASIHHLGRWLAEHPEVDTPTHVLAQRVVDEREYVDPAARVAAVERFARIHGVALAEGPLYVWATVRLGDPRDGGLTVQYTLSATKANVHVLPGVRPEVPPADAAGR